MRFHSQNLKKEDRENVWFNSRCWIYPFSGDNSYRTSIGIQLVLPSESLRFTFDINDGDSAFGLSICVFLFGLYINIENPLLNRFARWLTINKQNKYGCQREFGFYTYGDAIVTHFWHDSMDSSNNRHIFGFLNTYTHVLDILLGKNVYTSEVLKEKKVEIPMPEKTYLGKGTLELCTWKRPRWFAKSIRRVTIEVEGGVPHPGKGTTSYNCDDNALHSLTTCEDSIEKGVGVFVGSVLDYRNRYPL